MALVAGGIAMNPDSRVLALVAYAWAGLGATLGPVVLYALFWKRTTRYGALAGLVAGGITVIVWGALDGGIFDIYELLPGFIAASIVVAAVSLLSPRDTAAERSFVALSSGSERLRQEIGAPQETR